MQHAFTFYFHRNGLGSKKTIRILVYFMCSVLQVKESQYIENLVMWYQQVAPLRWYRCYYQMVPPGGLHLTDTLAGNVVIVFPATLTVE